MAEDDSMCYLEISNEDRDTPSDEYKLEEVKTANQSAIKITIIAQQDFVICHQSSVSPKDTYDSDLKLPNASGFHLHHLHLGFVHPLQDVALHQCLPSSSVCCFPNPGGSLLLCYVILPSSAWSSSRPLPSPWLPLCASLCPLILLYDRPISTFVSVCILRYR